ncbi:MAG: 3-deoxy-7-phosphoheptulonate synthase [Faecalibacterium prausnitzii]
MIISTKKGTPKEELEKIVDRFEKQGLDVTLITGKDYNVFGLVGDTTKIDERDVLANPWIDNVTLFRGGAYKPRTSPYSFQGLETEGILDMVKAREATGMPIVSELMSEERIPEFEEYVDVVQIGARNMQNFQLLKAVGKMHKPVLLKRGLCNTIEEWIMSAEYIMAGGNEQVILCERGIRTFEKYTRNTLDLSAVPIIHEKTHLPVIVDPSHATGKANLVEPMMIAAVAAGADGLEVEVHYDPRHAWSDGAQCLTPDAFAQAMAKCRQVAWAIGRDM